MRLTVFVPTYRRPADLARCLKALDQQLRPADEVLITVRDNDQDTWNFLGQKPAEGLPLKIVTVTVPGVVAAMNAGFAAATSDIVCVTDDDAAPHPDWLQQIEAHFTANDKLGGLGGRDWTYINNQLQDASTHPGASDRVGQVQWFGRMIGNHHIGTGLPQSVDILKGVNMSLRRAAIAGLQCDTRLKGTGAQVHFEVALSLSIKERGWELLYDPAVAVDHYPAQRFDEDQRQQFNPLAFTNKVHNETLVILDHLPLMRRLAFCLWALLIGTRDSFGLVQWLRFLPKEGHLSTRKLQASLAGRWQGWCTWRQKSCPTATALNA